jgi:hypothetical protein
LTIEAQATIRYVSKTGTSTPPYTSWETAATSIQLCLNVCVDDDTIYVANGVYKENLVINTAISLIGSSMDSTVIDGRDLGNYTIVLYKSATLENFYIYGVGSNVPSSRIIRSMMLNTYIKIYNCLLLEGGVAISMVGGNLSANNLIIRQVGRGINLYGESNNYVDNCLIYLNYTDAQGINIGVSSEVNNYLTNNIILFTDTNNTGYGILVSWTKNLFIQNNLISGYMYNIFSDIINNSSNILNTVLSNNIDNQNASASIWSQNDNLKIYNTVFQNNKIAIEGGDINADYNLFWKNDQNINGTIALGDSNLYVDPMFVNDTIPTANGGYDYHLQKYSPAIDRGDPAILDVDGSRSDIGMFGGPLGQKYTYQDLAPKPPRNLTATMDSGLVHLKWNKNTEADLFRYRVYRDTVPDFIYDTTKIIAVISDTSFYDDPPQKYISGNYYYKITAIDSAYHQSPASEEKHINITGIPEAPPIVVEHYRLLNNYPNPFNPSTTIPYRLKEPGYVKVMVYNLLGELVRVLVNQYQSAGYYEVLFHPTASERKSAEGKIEFETGYGDIVSGIYLYRIEVIGEGNIPVYTDMKKMMLVK